MCSNSLLMHCRMDQKSGARVGGSPRAAATNSGSERAYVAKHPANLQPSGVAKDRAIPVSIVALHLVLKVGNRVALNKGSTKKQAFAFGAIQKYTSAALKRQSRSQVATV